MHEVRLGDAPLAELQILDESFVAATSKQTNRGRGRGRGRGQSGLCLLQ